LKVMYDTDDEETQSRSGRIFSNRIQSNDYFEVIGVTDYRYQKVIVTKYPDPDAAD